MLAQSDALAPLAAIAVQHRERLDGSGYPRRLSGGAISRPARVLAAADAYRAMREPRPHRPPRPAVEAAAEVRGEVRAGRLDAETVDAVLGAAGHDVPRRREHIYAKLGTSSRAAASLFAVQHGLLSEDDGAPPVRRLSGQLG